MFSFTEDVEKEVTQLTTRGMKFVEVFGLTGLAVTGVASLLSFSYPEWTGLLVLSGVGSYLYVDKTFKKQVSEGE